MVEQDHHPTFARHSGDTMSAENQDGLLATSIDRSTLREQVAETLKQRILRGDWDVGDLLPSQAQLSEMFSVSVPIIREALQVLQGAGLVNVIHGKGAVVIPPNASDAFSMLQLLAQRQMLTVADLWEVRYLLEPEIAALAAERATPSQIDELQRIIAPTANDSSELDIEQWVEIDLEFHRKLATATGNSLLPLIMGILTHLFEHSLRLILQRKRTAAPQEHAAIVAALQAHDPKAARAAMHVQIASNKRDIAELETTRPLVTTG